MCLVRVYAIPEVQALMERQTEKTVYTDEELDWSIDRLSTANASNDGGFP